MPCYQSAALPAGVTSAGRTAYTTEADCLQACKEGACCESNGTCSVKPQCQCQGTGQTFRGVGTVCTPNPCLPCGLSEAAFQRMKDSKLKLSFSDFGFSRYFGGAVIDPGCTPGPYPCDWLAKPPEFFAPWANHFNSLVATLSFHSATSTRIVYRGSTGSISSPSGGSNKYYYEAAAVCGGSIFFSADQSRGCQSNSGFTLLTAADASQSPIASAPSSAYVSLRYNSNGEINQISSFSINTESNTTVFCAKLEAAGCLGAAGCANDLRFGFSGLVTASLDSNPLP